MWPAEAHADAPQTPRELRAGFEIGVYSVFLDGVAEDARSTTAASYGMGMQWRFSEFASLDGAMLVTERGYEQLPSYALTIPAGTTRDSHLQRASLRYFQVPVLLSVFPAGRLGPVSPKVSLGGYGSLLLATDLHKYDNDPNSRIELRNDTLHAFDAGYVLAAGADFEVDGIMFGVAFRVEQGLVDVDTRDDREMFHDAIGGQIAVMY
jgi:hypothetical protein